MVEMVHTVAYTNEYGDHRLSAEFGARDAAQMAANLLRDPRWGRVTTVTITRTDRPVDTRTIAEAIADAEAQAVA